MFESISFFIALIGSTIGGIYDLKTSDMLDVIPYTMIVIALLIHGITSYFMFSYWPILNSILIGLGFLGFGYVMYFLGQWGGGDAWMLSAIGFLLPSFDKKLFFPFPMSYLLNVFIVGTAYMLAYALVYTFINRKILFHFKKEMKANSKILTMGSLVLFCAILSSNLFLTEYFGLNLNFNLTLTNSILIVLVTIGFFIIYKFAKTVEDFGFKKRIPVSKLKPGDVLLENKLWKGIAKKEIRKIKRKKKYVWIKEGVRFAPTFPLALLFTFYFGDGIIFFVRYLI